eukprot:6973422-Alexandrium_andersonii.AAC.1
MSQGSRGPNAFPCAVTLQRLKARVSMAPGGMGSDHWRSTKRCAQGRLQWGRDDVCRLADA